MNKPVEELLASARSLRSDLQATLYELHSHLLPEERQWLMKRWCDFGAELRMDLEAVEKRRSSLPASSASAMC